MAQPSRAQVLNGPVDARVLVVEARFYDAIADALLDGATAALAAAGARATVLTVPGALEIASAISLALDAAEQAGRPFDAVVALGCVIRGETTHYDLVAGESARALTDLAIARRMPLGNGILTVETMEQAEARARRDRMDKGGGAAEAALALVRLRRGLPALLAGEG